MRSQKIHLVVVFRREVMTRRSIDGQNITDTVYPKQILRPRDNY